MPEAANAGDAGMQSNDGGGDNLSDGALDELIESRPTNKGEKKHTGIIRGDTRDFADEFAEFDAEDRQNKSQAKKTSDEEWDKLLEGDEEKKAKAPPKPKEKEEKPEAKEKSPEKAPEFRLKGQLKVRGQVKDVDLTPEEAMRELQRLAGINEKHRETQEKVRQYEELLQNKEALRQHLGLDEDALAAQRMQQALEEAEMTDEQRTIRELQQKLESTQTAHQQMLEEMHRRVGEQRAQKQIDSWREQFASIQQQGGLPKDAATLEMITRERAKLHAEGYKDVDNALLAKRVEEADIERGKKLLERRVANGTWDKVVIPAIEAALQGENKEAFLKSWLKSAPKELKTAIIKESVDQLRKHHEKQGAPKPVEEQEFQLDERPGRGEKYSTWEDINAMVRKIR